MINIIAIVIIATSFFNFGLEQYKTTGVYGYKLKYDDNLGKINEWLYEDIFTKIKLYKVKSKYCYEYEEAIYIKYGPVKTEKKAIEIAESIWLSLYGFRIYKQYPFKTVNKNDRWVVYGSTYELEIIKEVDKNKYVHYYRSGCPVYLEIRKKDGKILALD